MIGYAGASTGDQELDLLTVVERSRRMLENGATRRPVANVIGVDANTIYKYLPVQFGEKKSPCRHIGGKAMN